MSRTIKQNGVIMPRPRILESRSEFGAANGSADTRLIGFAGTVYKNFNFALPYSDAQITQRIKEYLASAGWSLVTISLEQSGYANFSPRTFNISVTANVYNQYTSEQARQSLIHDLGQIQLAPLFGGVIGAIIVSGYMFSSIDLKIVNNINTVADNANDTKLNTGGGLVPTVGGVASELLFGKNINVFGLEVPQIAVYGALGLAIYTAIKK